MSKFDDTGCSDCNVEQVRTGNPTALCDIHELGYLEWTLQAALKDYIDKVNEILGKEKEC